MERYSEYKASGVKWLGEIPNHWEVEPFGRHFSFRKGLPITKANLIDSGEAVISYGQIHAKENLGTTMSESLVRYVSRDYLKSHPQCLLTKDDFVFADTSEDIGGSGNFVYNDFPANIFAGYHTIVAKQSGLYNPSYYAYLFKSECWRNHIRSLVNGVKVYSIGRKQLKSNFLLFPSYKEQDAIVRYLDAATSKIDKAIAMQQKMIDLLNERKQIIVQNAVTKGLDDKVEMKDSGVEWIGMIPKHWKIIRLKNVFYKRIAGSWGNEQNVSPKNTVCLRIADFEYSRLQFKKRENYTIRSYTAKEIENKKLSKGDLLIEKSGGGEKSPVGRCVVYNLEIPDVMYANFMEKLSTRGNVDSYFICYLLSCFYSQGMIWPYVKATTGIQNLDIASLLSKEYIFVPPKSEQQAIVAYLGKEMQRFDSAISNCQRQITLLQERKQIIINEVVTGKVKVS